MRALPPIDLDRGILCPESYKDGRRRRNRSLHQRPHGRRADGRRPGCRGEGRGRRDRGQWEPRPPPRLSRKSPEPGAGRPGAGGVLAEDISKVFESPVLGDDITPVAVERLDLKRGFCFVFLKDVATQEEKERAEAYVSQINGMYVPNILP